MTTHTTFNPHTTEINPEFHRHVSPKEAAALLASFYKSVPDNGGSGLERVGRIEKVLSLNVAALTELSQAIIAIETDIDELRNSVVNIVTTLDSTTNSRFEAAGSALTILGNFVESLDERVAKQGEALRAVVEVLKSDGDIAEKLNVKAVLGALTITAPDGRTVDLEFPDGFDGVLNEQGMYGFRVPAKGSLEPVDFANHILGICHNLLSTGLVSAQGADNFATVMAALISRDLLAMLDVAQAGIDVSVWSEANERALITWRESDREGFFAFNHMDDPAVEQTLLNAMLRITIEKLRG